MSNTLFPIFIKPDQLDILLVGGGEIALEKAQSILKQNPNANIEVVSLAFTEELIKYLSKFENISIYQKAFESSDMSGKHIVVAATNNYKTNEHIRRAANKFKAILNIADKPSYCDFYLGSIVKKGDLKIGISTNGKSPTLAKRMREYFEAELPEETQELLNNLNRHRNKLSGNLSYKIKELNKLTAMF